MDTGVVDTGVVDTAAAYRRLGQAATWAVLGVPAVVAVVTLVIGEGWKLDGWATLLPAAVIFFVGATASSWAGTAPIALGCMAGEVVAIGSLFRGPGGGAGVVFALACGAFGGWAGLQLGDPLQPRPELPEAGRLLGGRAVVLGLVGWLGLTLVLSAIDPGKDLSSDRPAANGLQQSFGQPDDCSARLPGVNPNRWVKVEVRGPSAAVPVGTRPEFGVSYRIVDRKAFAAKVAEHEGAHMFVVVRPVGADGPVYSGWEGGTSDATGLVSGTDHSGSWNGTACTGPSAPSRFSQVAQPGRYEAQAVVAVGDISWASAPTQFEVG
jgi:hypothetical protein